MAETTKKTPSPKVIASYVLREVLADAKNFSAEDMKMLVDSRISDEKREKVLAQAEKIALKFRQRLEGTIHKFEGKPVSKKGKPSGTGPTNGKPMTDERAAKAKKKLKKAKG